MNGNLEPSQFDRRLLPTVIAIILAGLAALAWEWHNAHTPAAQPSPGTARQYDPPAVELRAARDVHATAKSE